MTMDNNPLTTPEMKRFFSSLPTALQETIEQSGVKFTSLEHLKAFVRNLNQ